MEPLTASFWLLALALSGCGIQLGSKVFTYSKKITKTGSAYVGKIKEIKNYLGMGGIQVSQNIHLSLKTLFEHVAVFGKSGSYKSTVYLFLIY